MLARFTAEALRVFDDDARFFGDHTDAAPQTDDANDAQWLAEAPRAAAAATISPRKLFSRRSAPLDAAAMVSEWQGFASPKRPPAVAASASREEAGLVKLGFTTPRHSRLDAKSLQALQQRWPKEPPASMQCGTRTLRFPATAPSRPAQLALEIRNCGAKPATVDFATDHGCFHVRSKHRCLTLPARSFVLLPVLFAATRPGVRARGVLSMRVQGQEVGSVALEGDT